MASLIVIFKWKGGGRKVGNEIILLDDDELRTTRSAMVVVLLWVAGKWKKKHEDTPRESYIPTSKEQGISTRQSMYL